MGKGATRADVFAKRGVPTEEREDEEYTTGSDGSEDRIEEALLGKVYKEFPAAGLEACRREERAKRGGDDWFDVEPVEVGDREDSSSTKPECAQEVANSRSSHAGSESDGRPVNRQDTAASPHTHTFPPPPALQPPRRPRAPAAVGDIEGHFDTHNIEDYWFIKIDRTRHLLNERALCVPWSAGVSSGPSHTDHAIVQVEQTCLQGPFGIVGGLAPHWPWVRRPRATFPRSQRSLVHGSRQAQ